MKVSPFSEEVVRLIEAHIDSVDQLDILRLLSGNRLKQWTPAELAEELQAEPQSVCRHLESLQKRGLLTLSGAPEFVSQYGARSPEVDREVQQLLQIYNERPVTMIRLLENSVVW